ncbi:Trafficking protein particle complex subunit 10 [Fulvia fulva]|uniref:Trafficking protein particle complex subunit 10 n=1 Tax=Passalora fulva TaxID=5499 RepID=A0A9Q8P5P7_PASFU|nr:Trafficking protein particle complex subunit 10 [Fulvia fulva]KAK4633925.1 Trafficking protein particle complex subunit 10 [Fulvia fulva]UJO14159.1 Trafficking protein particle complex subunit 10 [Fulvia fulva]WPV11794.1 Trafficking protein particle complex subunit 10 [Fulvia fulva]
MDSSSKVTVEYHDASGVFPLVSRDILQRLPLRNLNWQSLNRPLRQIKSLHVDFVPDKETVAALRPTTSRNDSNGPNSFDIVGGGGDAKKDAVKTRKHQIPGFRTSPYLKIYVLRCDDKENYKDSARKQIRDWVRENAQPVGKTDHDAFEWMLLHVVVPDTVAASEPRWREGTKDPDELKERKAGAKLTIGKSTRTVFDRLRADFNDTGKRGVDRVAQIRIPKDRAPADLLPTPAVAETHEENADEQQKTWNDWTGKLKNLILGPFDRRVRQYEADIAEQETRRSMPGWNFCTFFIHKEGLAKALESIGLVEDALAIYDELSLGLEVVLRDIAAGQTEGAATSFAAYTDDIKERIVGTPPNATNGTHNDITNDKQDTASLFSKDYRERIVRSNISTFDFLCYLFSRQKALILRLANARAIRIQLDATADKEGGEDLVLTSEVCWRASNFIHNAARALRQDLLARAEHESNFDLRVEMESIVSSWTWAVAGLVLHETAAPALEAITTAQATDQPNGKTRRPTLTMGLGANVHPQRTSSLPTNKLKPEESQLASTAMRADDHSRTRPQTSTGVEAGQPNALPGQAELATYRAELIVTRRKMLEQLARLQGWHAGWSGAKQSRICKRSSVKLEDKDTNAKAELSSKGDVAHALHALSPSLQSALSDKDSFEAVYERLTNFAIRHYYAATLSKPAETLLGDIALLKCQQKDYEQAASCFKHIIPLMATDGWNLSEVEALKAYCQCLKSLQRAEDYVRHGLTILAKVAVRNKDQARLHPRAVAGLGSAQDVPLDLADLFADLASATEGLQQDVVSPLQNFFSNVKLDTQVIHHADGDGFSLNFSVQHVLGGECEIGEITTRLVNHEDAAHEVLLRSRGPVILQPGLNQVELVANAVTHGPYLIDKIMFRTQKLCFVEELRPPPQPTALGFTEANPPTVTIREHERAPPFVFLYPLPRAFNADLRRAKNIHVDKPRHFEIRLDSAENDISSLDIKLRPTSAGLRIHLADAVAQGVELLTAEASKPGQISLGSISAATSALITIPYTVENANRDAALRLEIDYHTAGGTHTFLKSLTVPNELPLDVDVNDMFHLDCLFSSFTVRTTTPKPFTVLGAMLDGSAVFAVEAPPALPLPLTVFRSQPLSLVYKITRKESIASNVLKQGAALSLVVRYQPTDELLLGCIRRSFVNDLKDSEHGRYIRLLEPILSQRLRLFLKAVDLETTALLGESDLPSFGAIGWAEILNTLPETVRRPLTAWLEHWHSSRQTVDIFTDEVDSLETQSITISVDVPNLDMVFATSLDLSVKVPAAGPPILVLGQPVEAVVRIRSTSQWSAKNIFPSVPTFTLQGEEETKTAFVCDVGVDSDAWILGGKRRSHFTPSNGEEWSFKVLLIPLRAGVCSLPTVEVQHDSADPEANAEDVAVSVTCETHYESAGQVVHVIHDRRTTKVHIAESSGAMLLPSSGTRPSDQVSSCPDLCDHFLHIQ